MEASTSSRDLIEDTSEGQISWRESVMKRNPRIPERARPMRIIQSFHGMEVIKPERMWESPMMME